jgi:hypothetical protein
MNSTNLPNNLNVIQKPKPYDYNYIISMSYRLTGTETALNLPLNKSYGNIKYAIVIGYKYFDSLAPNTFDLAHIHIANSENPLYISSPVVDNNNFCPINYYINYGVFNGSTISIICAGFAVNYRLELFINYYY